MHGTSIPHLILDILKLKPVNVGDIYWFLCFVGSPEKSIMFPLHSPVVECVWASLKGI